MNSRQIQYAVLLSEVGNFSKLAEKLNITQPALSKQILSLEKELGVQLFDRNNSPLTLTVAGEYFVEKAKEILYKEKQLLHSMEQFKTGVKGQLVIGITPFRSAYMVSKTIKVFREKYPGVQVKLLERSNNLLKKDVVDGKFDFAIVNLPVDESQLEIIPMEPDKLVLVMPKDFSERYPQFADKNSCDFKDCENIPFAVVGKGQEMRILFDELCNSSGVWPNIAAEVISLTTSWEMVNAGITAAILPLQFVNAVNTENNIKIVELTNKINIRQPAIVYKKGQFISEKAQYAISLLS